MVGRAAAEVEEAVAVADQAEEAGPEEAADRAEVAVAVDRWAEAVEWESEWARVASLASWAG